MFSLDIFNLVEISENSSSILEKVFLVPILSAVERERLALLSIICNKSSYVNNGDAHEILKFSFNLKVSGWEHQKSSRVVRQRGE